MFIAEWRVLVETVSDPGDAGVVVARDDPPGHVFVEHASGGILIKPGNVLIDLAPGVFHSFRIESRDMDAFELLVDGQLGHLGFFDSVSLLSSFVNFGDGVQGARSLTHWDYFRFGVVPEPGCGLTLLLVAGILVGRLRYR